MSVKKISAWMPVSDEDMVDFGIGSLEQQIAARARIDREHRKMDRYWRSLPWYVRAERTVRAWLYR